MQTVIIVVHLMIVLAMAGLILLQRSEGGGLGMGGGGVQGFMTGRGQASALTRATAVLAAGFFLTSLVLSMMGSGSRATRSILDSAQPASQSSPLGSGSGGVLNQLQQQTPAGGAPAPTTPQVPQSR
ncbi:MAG: preprotein translocase subunit SecG [Beijerinckiaceae bacterium]